jgi:DNA-binding transcriptional MerR regulator
MTDDETLLTVAQMAEASGVTAHTLRYYEHAGLIRPVARNAGNQRRYSAADVEWVAFLLRLRQTGMPIARMREYADLRQLGDTTIEERVHLLEAHQITVREQMALLRTHADALDAKMCVYRRALTAAEGEKP